MGQEMISDPLTPSLMFPITAALTVAQAKVTQG